MLLAYGDISGHHYSPRKSRIFYSDKVRGHIKSRMQCCSRIVTGDLPFVYLGVPIFRGMPKFARLKAITDKVINKCTKWNGHTLSLAGRCCYINSVIASSLVHTMMVYKYSTLSLNELRWQSKTTFGQVISRRGAPTMLIARDVVLGSMREALGYAPFA